MSDLPHVTAIMPTTAARQRWAERARRLFWGQDYPNKSLVVVSGEDGSIGAKRNAAIQWAPLRTDLIMHWDDDDWMAPNRISAQVSALLTSGADICGAPSLTYLDVTTQQAYRYDGPHTGEPWLAGGTLLYRRRLWEQQPFPDASIGEDAAFLDAHSRATWCDLDMSALYVAIRHGRNTNPTRLSRRWVDPPDLRTLVPLETVQSLMGNDWPVYEALRLAESSVDGTRAVSQPEYPAARQSAPRSRSLQSAVWPHGSTGTER